MHPHPLAHSKGPLNMRGRVKMTWNAGKVDFNNLIFQNFPGKYTPGTLMLPVLTPTQAKSCLRSRVPVLPSEWGVMAGLPLDLPAMGAVSFWGLVANSGSFWTLQVPNIHFAMQLLKVR